MARNTLKHPFALTWQWEKKKKCSLSYFIPQRAFSTAKHWLWLFMWTVPLIHHIYLRTILAGISQASQRAQPLHFSPDEEPGEDHTEPPPSPGEQLAGPPTVHIDQAPVGNTKTGVFISTTNWTGPPTQMCCTGRAKSSPSAKKTEGLWSMKDTVKTLYDTVVMCPVCILTGDHSPCHWAAADVLFQWLVTSIFT